MKLLIKKIICKLNNHIITFKDTECNTRYFAAQPPLDIERRYFCSRCEQVFRNVYIEKATGKIIRID